MATKYPQLPYSLGRKTSLCKAQLPPACRTGGALPAPPLLPRAGKPFSPCLQRHPRPTPSLKHNPTRFTSTLSSRKSPQSLSPSSSSIPLSPSNYTRVSSTTLVSASSPISTAYASPNDDPVKAKLAQVAKRLESTSKYFKSLGSLGFWGQLVCTVVAAMILSFSVLSKRKITSPPTLYATAGAIAAAFVSVFWSFGYIRLSDKLRRTANDPSKAPPRVEVVKSLKKNIVLNLLGMGAAVLGMQATVGLLAAKALTSSVNPFYQGIPPGYSPVLALDVFLVEASANTILSHFLGLVCSLGLLRSVTSPPSEIIPGPRIA